MGKIVFAEFGSMDFAEIAARNLKGFPKLKLNISIWTRMDIMIWNM